MDGYGVLYYSSGAKAYEGNWKQDKFHEKGTVYNEGYTTITGEFDYTNFDEINDYWIKYSGNFFEDNKEGKGTLFLSNGDLYKGDFKDDMIDGKGIFI